jgi:hypothetical protein
MPAKWRDRHQFAWQKPGPDPDDEGPRLTWRQLTPPDWSGTWATKIRGTVTRDGDGWVAYLRLEDLPGLSPITTVGRYATWRMRRWRPTKSGRRPGADCVRRSESRSPQNIVRHAELTEFLSTDSPCGCILTGEPHKRLF